MKKPTHRARMRSVASPRKPSEQARAFRIPEDVSEGADRPEEIDVMNMMSAIWPAQHIRPMHPLSVEDRSDSSKRARAEMDKLEPIEQVVARLRRARSTHAMQFLLACRESGVDLQVVNWPEGERLLLGHPADGQEELRAQRVNALSDHLRASGKRQGVIDLVKMMKGGAQ